MKILCCIPPYIMSYFNAGHHLPIYQVAAYLRRNIKDVCVDAIDFTVRTTSWRDVIRTLEEEYDIIAVLTDFDGVDTLERFIYYVRKLTPNTKIITFGRLSVLHSKMFEMLGVDGIGYSGDFEYMVASFCRYIADPNDMHKGLIIRNESGVFIKGPPGEYLAPKEWGQPDISEFPINEHANYYANDSNKFCGLPQKTEFVVQISKGCPYQCGFCDVQLTQGKIERRIDVDLLWDYLERSFEKKHFDYISFFGAVFTLNRNWVLDFCARNRESGLKFRWKCVTTINNLDPELISEMGRSGCIRIGVGLESLLDNSQKYIIKSKQIPLTAVWELAQLCFENNIELNCFLMVGFPGESVLEIEEMIKRLKEIPNLRVRPTVYTPYEKLKMYTNVSNAYLFNRQIMIDGTQVDDEQKLYGCIYLDQNYRKSTYAKE